MIDDLPDVVSVEIPCRLLVSARSKEKSDSASNTASESSSKETDISRDKQIPNFEEKPALGVSSRRVSVDRHPFEMILTRDDGSPVFDDEGLLGDRDACRAVSRALARNSRDTVAVRRMSDLELAGTHSQMVTAASIFGNALHSRLQTALKNEGKFRHEVEHMKRELVSAQQALVSAQRKSDQQGLEIAKLRLEIEEVKIKREEFLSNTEQPKQSMGQYFRLGWVRRQQNFDECPFSGL